MEDWIGRRSITLTEDWAGYRLVQGINPSVLGAFIHLDGNNPITLIESPEQLQHVRGINNLLGNPSNIRKSILYHRMISNFIINSRS